MQSSSHPPCTHSSRKNVRFIGRRRLTSIGGTTSRRDCQVGERTRAYVRPQLRSRLRSVEVSVRSVWTSGQ